MYRNAKKTTRSLTHSLTETLPLWCTVPRTQLLSISPSPSTVKAGVFTEPLEAWGTKDP